MLRTIHEILIGGHLGVAKTYNKICGNFYWPEIKRNVAKYYRTRNPCQIVGKQRRKIPVAPLYPILAFEEPFHRVLLHCVGPMPKTKKNGINT